MRIKLYKTDNQYWRYSMCEEYTQEEFDYVFKHLDFDKLNKDRCIHFSKKEIDEWFYKTYNSLDEMRVESPYVRLFYLKEIYKKSPKGYQYLRDNWGNGMFKIVVNYPDKQEFKTIVNKLINIKLIRGK